MLAENSLASTSSAFLAISALQEERFLTMQDVMAGFVKKRKPEMVIGQIPKAQ